MPRLPKATVLSISRFERALRTDVDVCDLRGLRFIDAYGLVATACSVRCASAQTPELRVKLPSVREPIFHHLAAMGLIDFLTELGLSSPTTERAADDASGVVVPLRSARDTGGPQNLSALLWKQLRDHVDPQVLEAVAEGVWEMVANALEHSGSDALIMGQIYRSARGGMAPDHDDRVQIVIGDVGRGIRASFLETGLHHPSDDREAVHLAMEYLVTSVDDDRGRGQGLSTTMNRSSSSKVGCTSVVAKRWWRSIPMA